MAKDSKPQAPTEWSNEEIAELINETQKSLIQIQSDLSALQSSVAGIQKQQTELQAELAAVAPSRSKIPQEMFTGITAQDVYRYGLMGAVIGQFTSTSPSNMANVAFREATINRALEFAELLFTKAVERHNAK